MLYNIGDIRIIPFSAYRPAQVAKLVDAGDSKSPAARCVGSSPTLGTKFQNPNPFSWIRVFSWLGAQKSVICNTPAGLLHNQPCRI